MLNHRGLWFFMGVFLLVSVSWTHAAIDTRVELKPEQESVVLKWKIPKSGFLAFETNMDNIETKEGNSFHINFEEFMDGEEDPKGMSEKLEFDLPQTFSATTILQAKEAGRIRVKLYMNPTEEHPDTDTQEDSELDKAAKPDMNKIMGDIMKQMEGTIVLRGEIDESGAIDSFYMAQSQKNLLALFFELPDGAVSVGDSWGIDVSLIQMGNGFVCDDAYRENSVSLVSLLHTDKGETIAVLRYFIYETVEGRMIMPRMPVSAPNINLKDQMNVSMSIGFAGEAEFLVEEGRWKKFAGIMETKSAGFMSTSVQQNLVLKYTDYVKQDLLEME